MQKKSLSNRSSTKIYVKSQWIKKDQLLLKKEYENTIPIILTTKKGIGAMIKMSDIIGF